MTQFSSFYLLLLAYVYLFVTSGVIGAEASQSTAGDTNEDGGGGDAEPAAAAEKACKDISDCKSCLANSLCVYLTCGDDHIDPKCVNQSASNTACGDKTVMKVEKCGNETQAEEETTKKDQGDSDSPPESEDENPPEDDKKPSSANDNPVDELVDEVKPIDKKQEPKYHATQHFDLASFAGGIALSLCIFGLIFIIFKFYSSRQQNIAYSSVDGKNQY